MYESYREEEGRALLKLLYDNPDLKVAVDTETTGLHVGYKGGDYCIGVSIAFVSSFGAHAHYFGINHPTGVNVSRETCEMLEYVLLQGRRLIFANVQFDLLALETISGTSYADTDFMDICTKAHLCNENMPKDKGVDSLGRHYLGDEDGTKIVDPFVEKEKLTGNQNITPEQMFEYAVRDAVITWRVDDVLEDHLVWKELPADLWAHKQRLIRGPLLSMRRRGVRIDTLVAQRNIEIGEAEMKRLARELGYPAIPKKPTKMYPNPDPDPLPKLGPIALEDIFLRRLGLPVLKRGSKSKRNPDGNPSFDKFVMEQYDAMLEHDERPEAKLVKEYRGWSKAVSASYKPYLRLLDRDGRVRCSYKLHGTVTGRLSCSEPNLQQITKVSDKPWNREVKECFIGREGYTLINADFKQLELRLLVAYVNDEDLKQVFEDDRDLFQEMSESLGWTRDRTKTYVYATNYGAGPKKHAATFGISLEDAKAMNTRYRNTYPAFARFQEKCDLRVQASGKIKLWSGRYRHFQYKSESYKAMNSVIQGGAADIVERVMVQCFEDLDREDECMMLLQVHDSITWEVRNDLVEEMMVRIQEVMEDVSRAVGHDSFDVKFGVDVGFWTKREEAQYEDWKLAA